MTRSTITSAALLLVFANAAAAQSAVAAPSESRWEVRVASGTMFPVGDQRQYLKSGPMTAAQVAWLPRPSLAVTGTFGWGRSRDLAVAATPLLNTFAADLGVEVRPSAWVMGDRVGLSAFAGLGAGARSYDYRNGTSDARHNVSGYASLGGELGVGRVGFRVEARQYVGGFKPIAFAGRAETRSDVMLMAALRFNRRAAERR